MSPWSTKIRSLIMDFTTQELGFKLETPWMAFCKIEPNSCGFLMCTIAIMLRVSQKRSFDQFFMFVSSATGTWLRGYRAIITRTLISRITPALIWGSQEASSWKLQRNHFQSYSLLIAAIINISRCFLPLIIVGGKIADESQSLIVYIQDIQGAHYSSTLI